MRRTSAILAFAAMGLAMGAAAEGAERSFYLGTAYSDVNPDYAGADDRVVPAVVGPPLLADAIREAAAAGAWNALPFATDGYQVMAGYRAFDWLAVELEYADLGGNSAAIFINCVAAPCPNRTTSDTKSMTVSVLGLYAIGKLDLFARAGLARSRSRYALHEDGSRIFSHDENETDPAYGVGVQYAFGPLLTRLEYERMHLGDFRADIASFGFAYTF
jgi:opacity protein-like surface antigen